MFIPTHIGSYKTTWLILEYTTVFLNCPKLLEYDITTWSYEVIQFFLGGRAGGLITQ